MPPAESMTENPSLTIAVLTYLRPEDIGESIPALLDQVNRYAGQAQVLVVDNDAAGSAREMVEKFAAANLQYVIEPTPGIAAARNRAISEVGTDLLVFIDDDERPTHDWLWHLVSTFMAYPGLFGVVGRVKSEFAKTPDPWLIAGRFFERRDLPTGTEVDIVATNNLLLDQKRLNESGLRFDESFGLTGGSDTMLSHEAKRLGFGFRFCREALVFDAVPLERMTREWVLRRAYRMGNSWSRTNLAAESSRTARGLLRLKLTVGGLARLGAGAGFALFGKVFGSQKWHANGWRIFTRGAGIFAGTWGHAYAEYDRPKTVNRRWWQRRE